MGYAAVALLAATGAINTLLLVGNVDSLAGTPGVASFLRSRHFPAPSTSRHILAVYAGRGVTLHRVERRSQHGGIDMVHERREPLLSFALLLAELTRSLRCRTAAPDPKRKMGGGVMHRAELLLNATD
jgi:hypothetical protein